MCHTYYTLPLFCAVPATEVVLPSTFQSPLHVALQGKLFSYAPLLDRDALIQPIIED